MTKEMAFRFNHRHEDLPLLIEQILKQARPKLNQLKVDYRHNWHSP
jgi:hypothetical protein